MTHPLRWLFAFGILVAVLLGCDGGHNGSISLGDKLASKPGGGESTVGSAAPEVVPLLSVRVGTVWEPDMTKCSFTGGAVTGSNESYKSQVAACDKVTTFHKTCEIPAGSAVPTSVTCDVPIPEGQIYYSGLRFDFHSLADAHCALVVNAPYWYRASNVAGFIPRWNDGSAIDCSDAKNKDCYSGVATDMVPDFPKYRALYGVVSDQEAWWTSVTKSANTLNPALSNRWSANDWDPAIQSCSTPPPPLAGDGLVCDPGPGSNYRYVCQDKWLFVRYDVTIRIIDVNDSGISDALGFPPLSKDQASSWTLGAP